MTVIVGDCLEVMPTLDAESIDAVICDPPYGLGFMGKAWDHGVPGVPFWTEALRVAKPGAHLLAFGGTRTYHRLTCAIEDAGWEIRDCLSWLYGSGFPKSLNIGDGRGTALKPAWEPIILARKPFKQTVAANVQEHGTGALNIDGCRIAAADVRGGGRKMSSSGKTLSKFGAYERDGFAAATQGRWPANVCLDEVAAGGLEAKSSAAARSVGAYYKGASRFFYTAKARRSERNAGMGGKRNPHPTVKPLDLMRWLCRLITPSYGLILDPFAGSGTTGCAAVLERFDFIGIEKESEYAAIAETRIAHWVMQSRLDLHAFA